MNVGCDMLRRGAVFGLALLLALPATADEPFRRAVREQFRDENYLLVEDRNGARLFVFSTGSVSAVTTTSNDTAIDRALHMTRSADHRTRVRGLTLLAGIDDPAALDAALVLLADPDAAVREEAVQLMIEHPDADIDAVAAIAANDPSTRVQQALADLIEERIDDRGD